MSPVTVNASAHPRVRTAFLSCVLLLWAATGAANAQPSDVTRWYAVPQPISLHDSLYQPGRDFPAGIEHGTWDFDEWPGVDHTVVYRNPFLYNSLGNEKNKIDYRVTLFDQDDHAGYLRTPGEMKERGMEDLSALLTGTPEGSRRMLAVVAHPDDDILLCGGLLAAASAQSWEVEILLVTNGADGTAGIGDMVDEELGGYTCSSVTSDGRIRNGTDTSALNKKSAIRRYARTLGVRCDILTVHVQLGGETVAEIGEMPGGDFDMTFGPATVLSEAIRDSLHARIRAARPTVMITHGSNGEYGNRMHILVQSLVREFYHAEYHTTCTLFTGFPEYNYDDHITHFLDLDTGQPHSRRDVKYQAFRLLDFLVRPGVTYDRPWDPGSGEMNGVFVKDYGYTPLNGYPPRYEFFQRVSHREEANANTVPD